MKQHDRKHAAILRAAEKVFLKQGFKGSSMDEVAERAGVSKRTIYDHFGDKEQLFKVMLFQHWRQVICIDEPLFNDQKPLAENLKSFSQAFLHFLYQPRTIAIFRLLIAESPQFPNLLDDFLMGEKAPFTQALTNYLQQKKLSGKLAIKNVDRAAAYFMGLLKEPHFWPMMLGFIKEKKLAEQNTVINAAVNFFLKAIDEE